MTGLILAPLAWPLNSRVILTLNMGLINKVDMACLSPVGYGV